MATKTPIVSTYAPKWPRQVFDPDGSRRVLARTLEILSEPGIYILYQDGVPYYIGQAAELRSRLNQHASNPRSRLYHGWNFFSFFVVKDPDKRNEIEAILIAAMSPGANNARPRLSLPRAKRPKEIVKLQRESRRIK